MRVFPEPDFFPILEEANFCELSDTSLGSECVTHDRILSNSLCFECKIARRGGQVISHKAMALGEGMVDHFLICSDVTCERLGNHDVRVHRPEMELIRKDYP